MLVNAAVSALVQFAVLAGVPFLFYFVFQKWRRKRNAREIFQRAGLQPGETRYLVYSIAFAAIAVAVLLVWSPPIEPFIRQGSAQRVFAGLGLSMTSILMALLEGGVKTGLSEEILFRGLIAGSLSRRLSFWWANLLQALVFLVPHLAVLYVMPEMAWLLPLIFAGALLFGWVRIRSGSIIGPWIMHASANIAMALMVAVRSGPTLP